MDARRIAAILLPLCLVFGGGCASTGHTANLKPAPDLQLRALVQAPEGAKVDWASLRGQAVVLEFWATWCGPCVAAIPHLNELAEKFADRPVRFIAITNEDESVIVPFLDRKPFKTWVGLDKDGATSKAYGVNGIPQTYLIDREGQLVADMHPAQLTEDAIEDLLADGDLHESSQPSGHGIASGNVSDDDINSPPLFQLVIRESEFEYGGSTRVSGGNLEAQAMALTTALSRAYGISPTRIQAAGVLPDGRYDINVTLPPNASSLFAPLLQQALTATFDLDVSRATREMDVLVLTAPGGVTAGLRRSVDGTESSSRERPTQIIATSLPIAMLQLWLEEVSGLPVFDETGLEGHFDFEVRVAGTNPDALRTAVQEQLALDLTPARRAVEVLVVNPDAGDGNRR